VCAGRDAYLVKFSGSLYSAGTLKQVDMSLQSLDGCSMLPRVRIISVPEVGCRIAVAWVRIQRLTLALILVTACHAAGQPLAQWTFDTDHIAGAKVADRVGDLEGSIKGAVHLVKEPMAALVFDGVENSVDVPNIQLDEFPRRQFSVEAWVSLEAGLPWGAIAGCFQDNGDFERGWLLGYDESHFRFAVSATGKLTYLTGTTVFDKGQWYHVVGTYDGQTMKLYVNGRLDATSTEQRGDIVYPPKAFLTIGAYRDDDEFFRLQGKIHEILAYGSALEPKEIEASFNAQRMQVQRTLVFRVPPHVRFLTPDSAIVAWETDEPGASVIEYGVGESWDQQVRVEGSRTEHRVTLEKLEPKARYQYRIRSNQPEGEHPVSEAFELENGLNFSVAPITDPTSPYGSDEKSRRYAQAAKQILLATGVTRGYGLVLDCNDGQLAYELARQSELIVFGVDKDRDRIARARKVLGKAGVYGSRVTLHHAESLDTLPFPQSFANLLVMDGSLASGSLPGSGARILALLQPATGVACLGPLDSVAEPDVRSRIAQWLAGSNGNWRLVESEAGRWLRVKRELPPDTGSWTHQYGDAGNSANSREGLQGVSATERLAVQWLGRPGADFGIDRNPRMPAPLAVNGRLFHQGMNRIAALDSYNGAVLWSLEIPALRRVNMPRDAGNWCADPDHLYVAIKDRCWVITAGTGEVVHTYPLADAGLRAAHDWGYVARSGELLFGSSVKQGAVYTDFWGKASWYDATSGPGTEKVCSDDLFAMTSNRGELKWHYHDGVILNSTIAIAGGRVLFVECRHPEVKALSTSRIGSAKLWEDQFLVALDAATGVKLWEKPIDTADGIVVFYLLATDSELFIMASAAGKYNLYAFSAVDGKSLWQSSHEWPKDNHGGHMQHPALVRNTIFLEPCGYEASTGKLLTKEVGRHGGCATYAATLNALIYRGDGGRISMWDIDDGAVSGWYNLRPSCWLSTVPANGMVLSPEGGGGCSCGNWLETSIGFAPALSSTSK